MKYKKFDGTFCGAGNDSGEAVEVAFDCFPGVCGDGHGDGLGNGNGNGSSCGEGNGSGYGYGAGSGTGYSANYPNEDA